MIDIEKARDEYRCNAEEWAYKYADNLLDELQAAREKNANNCQERENQIESQKRYIKELERACDVKDAEIARQGEELERLRFVYDKLVWFRRADMEADPSGYGDASHDLNRAMNLYDEWRAKQGKENEG